MFEPVIGLEVHVQIQTASKMFCSCRAQGFGDPPNSNICPVCTGQPGVLPVLNRRAVEMALKAALSFHCDVRTRSIFARKNYFYPDLPKGYQISQYEEPLAEGGFIDIPASAPSPIKRIGITRVHLEEDAGKLLHAVGAEELPFSLVDFNRCGVPLIEIVSEPGISSPDEAYSYLTEMKAILQYLRVSNCDMEKGEMRCDANISLRRAGSDGMGARSEVKNLNSFKAVRDALEFEVSRHRETLQRNERVVLETRLWDEKSQKTFSMRSKEEAHDYRYFPEPDLVPVVVDEGWTKRLGADICELPRQRRERFCSEYGLSDYDAGVITSGKDLADYFESVLKASPSGASLKLAANWVTTELLGKLNAENLEISRCPVPPERLSGLLDLIGKGTLSSKLAKEVFKKMWESGKEAAELVKTLGLSQVSDQSQVREWTHLAVSENPKAAEDFRRGNERALGALVGAVMKKSKGKANPALVNQFLKEILKS